MDDATKATEKVTKTVVVKKCLMKMLRPDLLPYQRQRLLDTIDQYTRLVSRMMRRASLLFLYVVVRRHEDGLKPPNFDDTTTYNDAYWKGWLRIGLDEFGQTMPVAVGVTGGVHAQQLRRYFDEVSAWLGTSLGAEIPEDFDRVLGHAAITFKTIIRNGQEVHFMDKLKRLCKAVAPGDGISGYDVLTALRNNEVPDDWPEDLKQFIAEARGKIGLIPTTVLYENTDVGIVERFEAAWWMQLKFAGLEKRKNMLAPVCKVSRMHVRLDATSLFLLTWKCLEPEEVTLLKWPTKVSHPDAKDRAAAKEVYTASKIAHEKYRDELKKYKVANPSYFTLGKTKPNDPETVLNNEHPVPKRIKRTQDMTDDEVWKAVRQAREQQRDAVIAVRAEIRATQEFKDATAAYAEYTETVHKFATALFLPFNDKDSEKGWEAAASVVTDGVSICIMYEKVTEEVPQPKPLKKRRAKATTGGTELPPCDDYDPYAPTATATELIGGLDPGRKDIAKTACIDNDGGKHVWGLSRGKYYADGGILVANRQQVHRMKVMRPHFLALQVNDTAALRVTTSAELRSYLEWNAGAEATWWEVAFRRAESRAKMQRYIGKRKVLDRFFSALRKDLKSLCRPGQSPVIAYGSAILSMASTGRGEAAVPTGAAFKACQRAFGSQAVHIEWEYKTTKVSWETRGPKEMAYKRYDPVTGKEHLHHTAAKRPPLVVAGELEAFRAAKQRMADKAKRRRGGSVAVPHVYAACRKRQRLALTRNPEEAPHYTECRELRFCPETRLFRGRDAGSALAIAGLHRLKLMGLGRPTAFRCIRAEAPAPA